MESGPLLKKIIYSSWFLAAVPALVIMLFIRPLNQKNVITIEPAGKPAGQSMYDDLNSDSISEFIMAGKGIPFYHLLVLGKDRKVYDQWNLQDDMDYTLLPFFTGNFDHDSFREIYVFSHKADSLFLNINEFFEPGGTRIERIFISKISYPKGALTSNICFAGFHDNNGDGKDELYFCINTGFGLVPRQLFYYDIANNRLKGSRFAGIICQYPKMIDVDNDNKPEIFGSMSASGNQKTKVPYSDWSSWLMVFNENLDFKFEPVEFRGYPNLLEIFPYRDENVAGYLASLRETSADTSIPGSSIMIYSADGKLIRSHAYKDYGISENVQVTISRQANHDRIFILSDKICELDGKLNIIRRVDLPFRGTYKIVQADVNNDRVDEVLLYSADEEKLVIYSPDYHKLAETKFNSRNDLWEFSHQRIGNNSSKLYLYTEDQGYFIDLAENRYYYLGFMAYPGTYFAFLILIFFTKKITAEQVVQKENLKQRLITLQLQGIKSQLDPHFTFNTLNSVASLIYHEDRQAAYDYMNKFTKLLRGMLNDAERIYRTLGEELDFVKTYLDLEKLRLGAKFSYEIEIGEGVSQEEEVPKLVLQTFAENSIKHGIMSAPSGGVIKISAKREKSWLKLMVEDNGIGRERALGLSSSTGRGLKLTKEFYDILNQINKRPIKHQITDLVDNEGEPLGTKVEVWVPAGDYLSERSRP